MATLIHPTESFEIQTPETLRDLRALVGGYPEFLRFSDGSCFVKPETSPAEEPVNPIATSIAMFKGFGNETFRGRVVFLSAKEVRSVLPVSP
jgi:hypothetical protein